MVLSEAVRKADMMRPNNVPAPEKRRWVMGLEAEIAEMMDEELQDLDELDDPELLMEEPQDMAYVMYLAAFIDLYQEEIELWQADAAVANQMIAEAKAAYRRANQKVMPEFKGVFI